MNMNYSTNTMVPNDYGEKVGLLKSTSEKKQVAIIGDRRVRVGDVFEGFRVTHIGSDGVTLAEHVSDEK